MRNADSRTPVTSFRLPAYFKEEMQLVAADLYRHGMISKPTPSNVAKFATETLLGAHKSEREKMAAMPSTFVSPPTFDFGKSASQDRMSSGVNVQAVPVRTSGAVTTTILTGRPSLSSKVSGQTTFDWLCSYGGTT